MWRVMLSNSFARSSGIALAALACACDGAGPEAPPASPLVACPSPDQAPLLRTVDGPTCTRVGADLATASGEWPDVSDAASPIVYVSPGNGAGLGTRESPFHDLASALRATPVPATVLLARGTYALTESVQIDRSVTLRGVGAGEGGTTLVSPAAMSALSVGVAESSSAISVTLSRLRILGSPSGSVAERNVPAVLARGASTALNLRDIVIERAGEGVRATTATVCARGLSVWRSRRAGLVAERGAAVLVRDFVIRDGENLGVLSDESVVVMRTGMVAHNVRDGVALRGVRTSLTPCRVEGCPAAALCEDFVVSRRCVANRFVRANPDAGVREIPAESACREVSSFEEVAVIDNGVTGLRAERLPPSPDASATDQDLAYSRPGAVFRGTRLVLGNTNVPSGTVGGDGIYVGPGTRGELDPNITREDSGVPGSLITANARMGLLIDGDRDSPRPLVSTLRARGEMNLSGAMVRHNRGPGMYVQRGALVERLGYGDFTGNSALGVGVALNGRIAAIQCEHFISTRLGRVTPESEPAVELGDGLSMAEPDTRARDDYGVPIGATEITQSEFLNNARYGVALRSSPVRFVVAMGLQPSLASGNPRGVNFDSAPREGELRSVEGTTTAPVSIAHGALSTPAASP